MCMCTCVPAYICVFDILMSYFFALTSNLLKSPFSTALPKTPLLAHAVLCLVHERHTKLSKAIWTPIGLQGIILPGFAPSVAIGLLAAGGVRLQQERSGRLARRGCSDQLIITWGSCLQIDGPLFLASERGKSAISPSSWPLTFSLHDLTPVFLFFN